MQVKKELKFYNKGTHNRRYLFSTNMHIPNARKTGSSIGYF